MKFEFELEEFHRNVPDEELIADVKRVASELKQDFLTGRQYDKLGEFDSGTITRRFGSWTNKVLKLAGLQRLKSQHNHTGVYKEELIADIKRVASGLKQDFLLRSQYAKFGEFSSSGAVGKFGSWSNVIKQAGLRKLEHQDQTKLSEEELFRNLEEVWIKLGRQPRKTEMFKPVSKYSSGPYKRIFGSWMKALKAFVEYINKEGDIYTEETIKHLQIEPSTRHKTQRNVSWRLRFIVMRRDNFKCKCGRSPATDPSIILHVDHKIAWANGGETVLENLKTLCSKCNTGKSDLE